MRARHPLRFFVVVLCLALLCAGTAAAFTAPPDGALDAAQALELTRTPGLTILDVRTGREFAAGHVPGALHIPVADLETRLNEVPTGPVLIVCRTGKRAERAWTLLHSARPLQRIWFLRGKPRYGADNAWTFAE